MSNISNIIQYLKGNESRFITITNQDNGRAVGKNNIYLSDIPNENLEHFIKFNLGQISEPTLVWIEMRVKQGVTSKKEGSCKIEVMPENYATPLPAIQEQPITPSVQQPSFLASPMANNVFGLGFPEILGMQVKANQLEDKKEQLAELKEEYKDLKQKYNLLEIDNRKLSADLAIAESKKEMAVMMVKAENRSFADSPVFQSIIDKAPEVLAGIAAMKGGVPAGVPAGLSAPSVSDTHDQFIEYINDHLSESQVNYLGRICTLMTNEPFRIELQTLVERYATN
ncbi:hypothetical protein [Flavobacterium mesophilum]|uniref:hypothetical protein n=1 Tax=Flavobacterium mesophilum TaxID=3143495 RepID=UPI0031DE1F77